MIVREVAEKSLACGEDSVMSAGSSPATGDVSGSDSISPVQGARVILKTETRRSMWRTTLATAGFLFLTKERQRVETRVISLRSVTRCVSSQNVPRSCTRSNTIRVRWGQVLSRSLGTGVCTSSLPLPVASVWGWGVGGAAPAGGPVLSAPLRGAINALSCRRGDLCPGSWAGSRAVVEAHGCETAGTAGGGAGPGSQAWRVQPGLPSHARLRSPEQGLGALSLGPGRSDPHGEGLMRGPRARSPAQ